jgi:hypothetical protein
MVGCLRTWGAAVLRPYAEMAARFFFMAMVGGWDSSGAEARRSVVLMSEPKLRPPEEKRNPRGAGSGAVWDTQGHGSIEERFLTSRTPFGMTDC